jgi:hypothetical protein
MIIFPDRFSSAFDDCEHITLGLLIAGAYDEQRHELVDNYGSDIVEKAFESIQTNYTSLLARF